MSLPSENRSQGVRQFAAFAAVYLIWGSTFLAIRYAIESVPPLMMAGTRFLLAGGFLYLWSRSRGAPAASPREWKSALLLGSLLFLLGNGVVAWAEQRISSGLTALLLTTIPLWMTLLVKIRGGSQVRLSIRVPIGLALGCLGVILLVGPRELAGEKRLDVVGAAALLGASISWAIGSLYQRHAPLPRSPLQSAGMQMLTGGGLLFAASLATGEWTRLHLAEVSSRSVLSIFYLSVFGSVIAFTAYLWLLRNVSASRVSTYAFVNPVVALFLGWAFAGEGFSQRSLLAAVSILVAVALILVPQGARWPRLKPLPPAPKPTRAAPSGTD